MPANKQDIGPSPNTLGNTGIIPLRREFCSNFNHRWGISSPVEFLRMSECGDVHTLYIWSLLEKWDILGSLGDLIKGQRAEIRVPKHVIF